MTNLIKDTLYVIWKGNCFEINLSFKKWVEKKPYTTCISWTGCGSYLALLLEIMIFQLLKVRKNELWRVQNNCLHLKISTRSWWYASILSRQGFYTRNLKILTWRILEKWIFLRKIIRLNWQFLTHFYPQKWLHQKNAVIHFKLRKCSRNIEWQSYISPALLLK